jgi:hypothetical protein
MHQVHRRDASLWIVPDWLVRIVPQVPGNRMAGAPRGGGPAHARLGHRPDRKAAAARRTRGRNGPPASLRSSVRLYGHGPGLLDVAGEILVAAANIGMFVLSYRVLTPTGTDPQTGARRGRRWAGVDRATGGQAD